MVFGLGANAQQQRKTFGREVNQGRTPLKKAPVDRTQGSLRGYMCVLKHLALDRGVMQIFAFVLSWALRFLGYELTTFVPRW
jgi:hypothetical protein